MMPDDWEDEDTQTHQIGADLLRKTLLRELDAVNEETKRKDPRRE